MCGPAVVAGASWPSPSRLQLARSSCICTVCAMDGCRLSHWRPRPRSPGGQVRQLQCSQRESWAGKSTTRRRSSATRVPAWTEGLSLPRGDGRYDGTTFGSRELTHSRARLAGDCRRQRERSESFRGPTSRREGSIGLGSPGQVEKNASRCGPTGMRKPAPPAPSRSLAAEADTIPDTPTRRERRSR